MNLNGKDDPNECIWEEKLTCKLSSSTTHVLYFVRRSLTTFSISDVGFGFNGADNKTPTKMSVLR